jgi:hypothetical protein
MFGKRSISAPVSEADKLAAAPGKAGKNEPKTYADAGDRAISDLASAVALHAKHMTSTAGSLTPAHLRTQAEVHRLMTTALESMKGDEGDEDEGADAETGPDAKPLRKLFPKGN